MTSRTTYLATFLALLALATATLALSFAPLGAFRTPVALAFAGAKALLIALFFMHLVEEPPVNALVLGVSLLVAGVFVGLTAADVATRFGAAAVVVTTSDASAPQSAPPGGVGDAAPARALTPGPASPR